MLEGLVINFAILAGLAAWFSWAGLGGAFFLGGALIPLGLFLGNSALGMPLTWCNWALVAMAAAGGVRVLFRRDRLKVAFWPMIAFHPMIMLPVLVFAIAVTQKELSYLPLNWDEFASWAAWCKQVFVADTWWRDDMIGSLRNYPKGWPMAAAFAQWPFQSFEELRGIALLGLFHISVLGMLFDVVRMAFERQGGVEKRLSFVLSWIVILLLLAGEASWKLLPPSLLVERPVLYWAMGLFIFALFAWQDEKCSRRAIASMGLIVASAITLKSPMTGLMIPAAFFGFLHWWRREREGGALRRMLGLAAVLSAVLVPGLFVVGAHALASPDFGAAEGGFLETLLERIGPLSSAIISSLAAYVASYKIPLTVISLIGLASGLSKPEQRPMVYGLAFFIVSYWLGLWPVYLFVISGNELETLPSLPRYARLPLRLMHVFGPTLLALNVTAYVMRNKKEWIGGLRNTKLVFGATTALVIGLVLFQAWGLDRTFLAMSERPFEDQNNVTAIKRIKAEGARLATFLDQAGIVSPLVVVIDQGYLGMRHRIAGYYGIGSRRGGRVHRYRVFDAWSWGESPVNMWMQTTDREGFSEIIMSTDVIWPMTLDDWAESTIHALGDTPECRQRPTDYFLIKTISAKFHCVGKFS